MGAGAVTILVSRGDGPHRAAPAHPQRPGLSVYQYGAKGDGVTDDSAAFRTCIEAARRRGRSVHVPEGSYSLTEDGTSHACLSLPAQTNLYGTGQIKFTPGARPSVRLFDIGAHDIEVSGLEFDLSLAPGGTSFAIQVHDGAERTKLTNLRITNNPHRGGVQVLGGKDLQIRRCTITDMAQNGVTLYGQGLGKGPDKVLIEDCIITAGIQPVDCEPVDGASCRDVTVRRCHLTSLGHNYALTLFGAQGAYVTENRLVGAIYLSTAKRVTVEHNVIDATSSPALNAVEAAYDASDCMLQYNKIGAAPGMTGVRVSRSQTSVPRRWGVQHNDIRVSGGTAIGISVRDAVDVTIGNNMITGDASDIGINLLCTDVVMTPTSVEDNTMHGFSTGIWATSRVGGLLRVALTQNRVTVSKDQVLSAGVVLAGPHVLAETKGNVFPAGQPDPHIVRLR